LLTIGIYIIFVSVKQKIKMEYLSYKNEINDTFSSVREFSFKEKTTPLVDEDEVNSLLDSINGFKKKLKTKSSKIYQINERIEKLTWLNDLDNESLMMLNDLISVGKDLKSSLVRQYVSMGYLRKRGIAKEEIKDFKNSIDELKESCEDLESVFFFLPEMPDFTETTKRLSLI